MTDLRISVRNTSETGGTFLTPFYVGFHDTGFDLFDSGSAASAGLEALAEDGNFAPLTAERLAASPDSLGLVVAGGAGPIASQEFTSNTITVDGSVNAQASFAAMILPSNDAFVGTDEALTLFDASGNFQGAQTVSFAGTDVYDAGTEVNTELDAAFLNQSGPNTGITENGVISQHPGFNGSLGNPVGEGDANILGGTNAFGVAIDPSAADFTQPGAQIATVHINEVVETQGSARSDFLFGSRADDIMHGGGGGDILFGRAGWDVLMGEGGHDKINAGSGDDIVHGGRGHDVIDGGQGNDVLNGDEGHDYINGGAGEDLIHGGSGRDLIRGADGNDTIHGEQGRDKILAGRGDDYVNGGTGADFLQGQAGNDVLMGGAGRDTLFGGTGDDLFVFASGDGTDVIKDFDERGDDAIALSVAGVEDFADVQASASTFGSAVLLNFGEEGRLFLINTDLEDLSSSDFLFA